MATFTLEHWMDDNWYAGRLREIPGVFSQGETLNKLKENIKEAYHLMLEDQEVPAAAIRTEEIQV